jgi:hypothetical protein
VVDALLKFDPRAQARNPVMFVVLIGTVVTLIESIAHPGIFAWSVTIWLALTVAFANFAEALAEGRGKAQAGALRRMRTDTGARRLRPDGAEEPDRRRHQRRARPRPGRRGSRHEHRDELDFLVFLARNAGKVCTRRMILENVWGPGYSTELHYLKVYAYRIRRKLHDEQGRFLQSDPSVGYRLASPD